MPQSHRILLAVGGGIAAYKCAILCSRLAQSNHDVRVMMTGSATQFIGAATLAALSGKPVLTDPFDPAHPLGSHIEAADGIDLMIVAPATANLLSDFASGRASGLVSTTYLQRTCPVLIAPAMSDAMWNQPSVVRNRDQLVADGCHIVGPESGWLSCRKQGSGRMSEPETILKSALEILSNGSI